jgi:hypothetical protein
MPDNLPQRLAAQLLSGSPARSPEAAVTRILAVQAQDPRGARLAIRARSTDLTAADVDRALTVERSLLVTWLNRGTLHLVTREDYPWLHALTAPRQLGWVSTRLGQLGVPPDLAERGVSVIVEALGNEGPLTRADLVERLNRRGVPTAGQAIVHQIGLASLRGLVIRGPMRGREQGFVLVRDWLGEAVPVDSERALAELARRYLAGHGPATERDLAYWAGVSLRDARVGLRSIGPELEEWADGLVDLAGRGVAPELPPPRLLGPFDPLLHGWASREPIVGRHGGLVTSNGIFRPILLVNGRATGTWILKAGRVQLQPFEGLEDSVIAALQADGEAVLRYLSPAA